MDLFLNTFIADLLNKGVIELHARAEKKCVFSAYFAENNNGIPRMI